MPVQPSDFGLPKFQDIIAQATADLKASKDKKRKLGLCADCAFFTSTAPAPLCNRHPVKTPTTSQDYCGEFLDRDDVEFKQPDE